MKAIIESYKYEKGVPQDKKVQSIRKLRELSANHLPKVWLWLKVVDDVATFKHNLYYLLAQKSKGRSVDERFAREICERLIGEEVEVKRDGVGQSYVSADSMEELLLMKL